MSNVEIYVKMTARRSMLFFAGKIQKLLLANKNLVEHSFQINTSTKKYF